MVLFTKYSNERAEEFRIRTEILEQDGKRLVRKIPASPSAWHHVEQIYERYLWLKKDLAETDLSVNACELCAKGVQFPYIEGPTFEEELDILLEQGKTDLLAERIRLFFSRFDNDETTAPFAMTDKFQKVFGTVNFDQSLVCRKISDIDMIFGNAIATESGYELIDYEWTFDFPVPVKFIQYRSLYYYILGNAKRDVLTGMGMFERFGIDDSLKQQFAAMEQHFQQYMLGTYMPVWKQYDAISDGVIPVLWLIQRESEQRKQRTVEVYYDDGTGYSISNSRRYKVPCEGRVSLMIPIPEGTRQVRIDPRSGHCIVRIFAFEQEGQAVAWTSNGEKADNGDLIFDTEDGQIYANAQAGKELHVEFLAEPFSGIGRELILHQHGRIRWMEGTKAWRLYQKLRGKR